MKPFLRGQRFRNGFGDVLEIADVTRYRVYFHITFTNAIKFEAFGLTLTYGDGMAKKSQMRETLAFFDEVNE